MKEEALKVANRLNDVIAYLSEMNNIPSEITDRILQSGLTICLLAGALDMKPLSDEEILSIADKRRARINNDIGNDLLLISFARAIEAKVRGE
jgi:hypothetical protein